LPEEARLNLVWIPWYHPYRYPLYGERWFPPAAVPPTAFPLPAGLLSLPDDNPSPATLVQLDFETPNIPPPSFGLDNSGYALRASAFTAGIDYAVMYYHGFDMQPAFELSATVFPGTGFLPGTSFEDFSAVSQLRPSFHTIDAWGGDAAYSWGPFTVRGEGAFITGRPLSRDLRSLVADPSQIQDEIQTAADQVWAGAASAAVPLPPSFVVRDVLEWGIGVDTNIEGYFLLFQLNQTDVFGNDTDLLIKNVETRLLGSVRKSFLRDDLLLQLQGIYGASSDYTLLLPRVTYRLWRGLEAQVGYLFIAGRQSSTGGQFKRNDEAFVRLRYLF
jgi:hypothetical protein